MGTRAPRVSKIGTLPRRHRTRPRVTPSPASGAWPGVSTPAPASVLAHGAPSTSGCRRWAPSILHEATIFNGKASKYARSIVGLLGDPAPNAGGPTLAVARAVGPDLA